MNRRALLSAPLFLAACAATGQQAGPKRFKGVWDFHFETSSFVEDSGDGPYWLAADGDVWGALTAPFGAAGRPWGRIALEIEGELSAPGHYGHLAAYSHELKVTRVLSARLIETDRPTRQNLPIAPPGTPSGNN